MNRDTIKVVVVSSLILNIVLTGLCGYLYMTHMNLNKELNEAIYTNHALQNELNITRSEIEYYKSQLDYYSKLVKRVNTSQGYIGKSQVNLVAVKTEQIGFWPRYRGVTMVATIEAKLGEGRVLVNTEPRIGIDIQSSVETARSVVEAKTGISLSGTDIILNIEAESGEEVVDGYSAGGCIAVALMAAIKGDTLNRSIYMTGTIEPDGSIGRVGAVPEKALAAAEKGASMFLIPKGQGTVVINVRKETHPIPGMTVWTYEQKTVQLSDYIAEYGYNMTIIEVGSLEEAYQYFVEG